MQQRPWLATGFKRKIIMIYHVKIWRSAHIYNKESQFLPFLLFLHSLEWVYNEMQTNRKGAGRNNEEAQLKYHSLSQAAYIQYGICIFLAST